MCVRRGVLKAMRDAGLTDEQADIAFVQFSVIVLGNMVLHENLNDDGEGVAIDPERIEQGIDLGLDLLLYGIRRSEEHTSELQSLMRISYAVFCLKTNKNNKLKNTLRHSNNTIPLTTEFTNQQNKT